MINLKPYSLMAFFLILVMIIPIYSQTSYGKARIGDPDIEAYPFKPSDGIEVNTFPDTSSFLNGFFDIDDRGFAEFPIVGKVEVSKMTRDELIAFLKDNFKSYLRYPNITVKPVVRVSLLGGFARPGLYYVDINESLWNVIQLAGGTLQENGLKKMSWERTGNKEEDDLLPYYEDGTSLKNMGFKSGEQFLTPSPDARTFWTTVADVMPILTFATTVFVIYNTYRRDSLILSR